MKILTVEDDPIAGAVLAAALKSLGHEAVTAVNGIEAWRMMREERHRVVISDWMLPGMDGLELCRRIRGSGGDYTYFILLSHLSATGENLDQAVTAGVDDFLAKPVNPAELRARLHVADRILHYATQVQQLESFIPICSYCKKVRDDKNYWDQIESYINARTGSNFSHGVCPDCYARVMVPQMRQLGLEPPPYSGGGGTKPA